MARLFIVTPAAAGTRTGNRHTALRWATLLRSGKHRVQVGVEWNGEACDALIALHARRSHESIVRFKPTGKPLIVVLTGTDLYRDLPDSAEAQHSLALADRLIVLQEAALDEIGPHRAKARVVYQSADPRLVHKPPKAPFRVAVIAHLRAEKDPMRAAAALEQLPDRDLEVVQVGEALDSRLGAEAEQMMKREPRYRWLGSLPHRKALQWMATSHVLVVSSVMEGGANVICEAARIGTPVIASRMSGNVGMLGGDYPAYYPVADHTALARLLSQAKHDAAFYRRLKKALHARRALFAPAAERRALLGVVRELLP
ncbi:MAG TPA: selenoneine biosynthesis selenosugar synthase SenB [Burkholderiales bacterium]|nr:selenoneine biosynthesis selenosugar synthase SenB [Burkholderiales bacterium]